MEWLYENVVKPLYGGRLGPAAKAGSGLVQNWYGFG